MRILANRMAPSVNPELVALAQTRDMMTCILAPMASETHAYNSVMEAIALAKWDLITQSLGSLVSEMGEKLPLFSRGLLMNLAGELRAGKHESVAGIARQLFSYHGSLGLL